jgi:hypothetical protein
MLQTYAFICNQLAEAAAKVQSHQLSTLINEGVQVITSQAAMLEGQDKHLERRAFQQYVALKFLCRYIAACGMDKLNFGHTANCTDDNPSQASENCPRCLVARLSKDPKQHGFIYPEILEGKPEPTPPPEKTPRKPRKAASGANLHIADPIPA